MDSPPVRRSPRHTAYDSNGRDYLADKLGCSTPELEAFVEGPTVNPHLLLWHRICVSNPRRFNDAIEWINTKYFYGPDNLEEGLLSLCLREDEVEDESVDAAEKIRRKSYADMTAKTTRWITQEIWARTVWRIVHENRGEGQMFGGSFDTRREEWYGFVVEMLCIAFHSIAFRGGASVWQQLIVRSGSDKSGGCSPLTHRYNTRSSSKEST